MIRKFIFIIPFCFLFMLAGCYSDMGNYDYRDINEVSISGIPKDFAIDRFDLLKLEPQLDANLYGDESLYEYEWMLNKKVISTSRNLEYGVTDNLGSYTLRFSVIDKTNRTKSFAICKLIVNSSSSDNGILIVSAYKGKADMSYLRLDKENASFSKMFYNASHEEPLGTNPRQLTQTFVDGTAYFMGLYPNQGVKLICNEGLLTISSTTLDVTGKIDGQFFLNFGTLYPVPDYSSYNPEFVTSFVSQWRMSPYGSVFNSEGIQVISDGAIYYYNIDRRSISVYSSNFKGNEKQYHFSPMIFETNRTPTANAGLNLNAGWTGTYHKIVFDENSGGFFDYYFDSMAAIDESHKFPGYKAIYGEDAYQDYLGFAALANGSQVKFVLLSNINLSNTANPPSISSVDAPLAKNKSRFFILRNLPYVYFNTENSIYKYNILNVNSSIAPAESDKIISLSDMGYSPDAKITDICMHRNEKRMLVAVSRYGNDTQGNSDELKGDLVEIDLEKTPAQVIAKHTGVCGANALVIYKYRTFARNDEYIVD